MSYPSRPQLGSRSNRANIGQKFKPLHEFRVQESSERSTTRTSNCLGEAKICCTRGGLGTRQRQLCYNYVCLSHSDLSGHFVVRFWICSWNFYLRFLARKQPDDRFFGEKVRGEKLFSVHWKISCAKKLLLRSICAQTILKYALTVDCYHPENSD